LTKDKKPKTLQDKIHEWVDKRLKEGLRTEEILPLGIERFRVSEDNDAAEITATDIQSMILDSIGTRKERSLARDFLDWLETTSGVFTISEVAMALGIKDPKGRANLYVIASRLVKDKVIERHGGQSGKYRKIEESLELIDWKNAPVDPVKLTFPLEVHERADLYPGNIVIIAGESNSGKTAMLLNLIKMNMDHWPIHYFNSEMGQTEMKKRLENFGEGVDWKFEAYARSDGFADVIVPDALNIVDFMECYDNFWTIGGWIRDIHKKIGKGICIIAIQKNRGQEHGRGGEIALEKPRLYLTISRDYERNVGVLKIVKAKNFHGHINPNGMIQEFKLVNGSDFIPQGVWHRPEDMAAITKKNYRGMPYWANK